MPKNRITRFALVCLLALPLSTAGCASMFAAVTIAQTVLTYVTDAQLVLSAVKSFINTYFAAQPNASLQASINAKIDIANQSLDLALRSTQGVEDLTQEQADAAFSDFRAAYADLLTLIQPLGVQTSSLPNAKFSASHNTLTVPRPLALH